MKPHNDTPQPLLTQAGRPVFVNPADGKLLASAWSETAGVSELMHRMNRAFAEAGVDLFCLCVRGGVGGNYLTTHFWPSENEYGDDGGRDDGLDLDTQARKILDVNPDACFMVRCCGTVPEPWADLNPDHMQTDENGKRYRQESWASDKGLSGIADMLRQIVRCCEAQSWGDRVIGYYSTPIGEGYTLASLDGFLFDQAPVMQEAYREFLRSTYGSDAALQAAWQDATVTLDTLSVPLDRDWREARRSWPHWPAPDLTQKYRDYFDLQRRFLLKRIRTQVDAVRDAATRPVAIGYDAAKQPLLGWLIRDAFDAEGHGAAFANVALASGEIDIHEILDLANLDFLVTPADYTSRSVGMGFEAEGAADSMVLRGKAMFIEDDARSWVGRGAANEGAWRTVAEARSGLLRNTAVSLSRGAFNYWMSIAGSESFFDDPTVQTLVREQLSLREKVMKRPYTPTEHAICMLIDDESPMHEDGSSGYQNLAVIRQRVDELALTGLPYRLFLLSDVERDEFPGFRAYLMPNLCRLDDAWIELIREKLLRNGAVLILGPGSGITDGCTVDGEPLRQLTGIDFELHDKTAVRRVLVHAGAHPALAGIEAPLVYGDSLPYGPILMPPADLEASGAVELGKASVHWGLNRAGLILKPFGKGAGLSDGRGDGDGAMVFSCALPLPAALLRALALYAGCSPWSELGDVVAASAEMVAVHSIRSGPRTIRLPNAATVTDLVSGAIVGHDLTKFDINLNAPETRVYSLSQAGDE